LEEATWHFIICPARKILFVWKIRKNVMSEACDNMGEGRRTYNGLDGKPEG
jgi:hypothetical protein